MAESLRQRAIHGLAWSTLERISQQSLQFLLSIVLARFLDPSEFGLIAMVSFFIAISQTFIDSGFGAALVQRQNVSHIDECSVFYFNLFMGILGTLVLYFSANSIAWFYSQPILEPIIQALSFLLIINSSSVIQHRLLMKRMDFKTLFRVNAMAFPLAGGTGATLAASGFGVWSLVIQQLAYNALCAIFLWWLVGWRPSPIFSFHSLKSLFGFGSKLLATGMLETVTQNMYELVIGRAFSPADLGFYSRARTTQQLIATNIHVTVGRVTFPVFSSIQNDKAQLQKTVQDGLSFLALVNFPLMIGMSVVARPLVSVVYSEKWLPCVPYLQLLCIIGLLHPITSINVNVLTACGRSDLTLRLELVKKSIAFLLLFATWNLGITAIVLGQVAVAMFGYLLNGFYTEKLIEYPLHKQLWKLQEILSPALIMGAAVTLVSSVTFPSALSELSTQVIVGVLSFVLLCKFARNDTYLKFESFVFESLGLGRSKQNLTSQRVEPL